MARTKGAINGSVKSKDPEYYKKYMKEYYKKNKHKMDNDRKKNLAIEKTNLTIERANKYGDNLTNVVTIIKKFSILVDALESDIALDLLADLQSIYEAKKTSLIEEPI
jgi:hypothetical protein